MKRLYSLDSLFSLAFLKYYKIFKNLRKTF